MPRPGTMEQPTTLTELVATVTATILNEIAPTATVTVTAAAAATPSVLECVPRTLLGGS